jgi:hypothetical protein
MLAGVIEADGARLPGSRRLVLRGNAAKGGMIVDATVLDSIKSMV